MNWYYEQSGQRQGPISDAELDRLLASGRVTWLPGHDLRSDGTAVGLEPVKPELRPERQPELRTDRALIAALPRNPS